MKHPIHRVSGLSIAGPYKLDVKFDDGTSRRIDFSPVLKGEIYGPLQDLSLFEKVRLDREVHTLTWPTGADFDPATLHDWPEDPAEIERAAKLWTPEGVTR